MTSLLCSQKLCIFQHQMNCFLFILQIILVFGAVPSFIPGVGIPVDKRTKFADVLKDEKRRKDLNIEDYHSRLVRVVSGLTALLEHDGLANIILSRYCTTKERYRNFQAFFWTFKKNSRPKKLKQIIQKLNNLPTKILLLDQKSPEVDIFCT